MTSFQCKMDGVVGEKLAPTGPPLLGQRLLHVPAMNGPNIRGVLAKDFQLTGPP